MVIARAARGLEKCLNEVTVTAAKIVLEQVITGRVNVAFDTIEIVAGVEIVDPMILRLLAVPPGPIWQLIMTRVTHGLAGNRN